MSGPDPGRLVRINLPTGGSVACGAGDGDVVVLIVDPGGGEDHAFVLLPRATAAYLAGVLAVQSGVLSA